MRSEPSSAITTVEVSPVWRARRTARWIASVGVCKACRGMAFRRLPTCVPVSPVRRSDHRRMPWVVNSPAQVLHRVRAVRSLLGRRSSHACQADTPGAVQRPSGLPLKCSFPHISRTCCVSVTHRNPPHFSGSVAISGHGFRHSCEQFRHANSLRCSPTGEGASLFRCGVTKIVTPRLLMPDTGQSARLILGTGRQDYVPLAVSPCSG